MKNHYFALICLGCFFAVSTMCSAFAADTPQVILLWPNGAPGSEKDTNAETMRIDPATGNHVFTYVQNPSITAYLPTPDKATGAAVVIAPGGGHREIWIDHEGYNVASWLSEHGVAAFVLKYRLSKATNSVYTVDRDELDDMQRAIRLVRSQASEWNINPHCIGVMGFSAGGELAFLAGMNYDKGATDATDPIQRQSSYPDFQALMYPGNLSRIKVSAKSPPAFLVCGANDRPDISEGLPNVYLEFKKDKVPVELHIYGGVGHGFGVRPSNKGVVAEWPELFDEWLAQNGFFKK
ncbi:MAG TPA: alpha/beta hydrolase [Pseudomonadales bacterium]|nr:alpha/beta hydrolase [Pseudomonadales bacterium]